MTPSMNCGDAATFSTPVSPAAQQLRPLVDRAGMVEEAAAVLQQLLAFAGQHQPPPDAIEQLEAHLLLELTDLARQRRLGDAQAQRCL